MSAHWGAGIRGFRREGGGMRRFIVLMAVVAGLVVPAAALAVTLDTSKFGDLIAKGEKCPTGGSGASTGGAWYHFVLNQVSPDYAPGITVTATFSVSGSSGPIGPTAVNKKTQHFDIFGIGTLLGGVDSPFTTGATGPNANLVLSGVACGKKGFPVRDDD